MYYYPFVDVWVGLCLLITIYLCGFYAIRWWNRKCYGNTPCVNKSQKPLLHKIQEYGVGRFTEEVVQLTHFVDFAREHNGPHLPPTVFLKNEHVLFYMLRINTGEKPDRVFQLTWCIFTLCETLWNHTPHVPESKEDKELDNPNSIYTIYDRVWDCIYGENLLECETNKEKFGKLSSENLPVF